MAFDQVDSVTNDHLAFVMLHVPFNDGTVQVKSIMKTALVCCKIVMTILALRNHHLNWILQDLNRLKFLNNERYVGDGYGLFD